LIVETALDDLRPGLLWDEFRKGAKAAHIRCEPQLALLWAGLVDNPSERLPWEVPLPEVARNFHDGGDITESLGDLFYFQPGQHGHFARKFEIVPGESNRGLRTVPETFVQDDSARITYPEQLLERCVGIAETIMRAMAPAERRLPDYRVVVHRLKYQPSPDATDGIARLVANSLGRWGRLGFTADRRRADGPIAPKGAADLLALASMLPAARPFGAALLRRIACRRQRNGDVEAAQSIERPHVDTRFFTGLSSRRERICTQAHSNGRWVDLPLDPGAITVLPALKAKRQFGLAPTLHRVVHREAGAGDRATGSRENVTLLLGTK